MAGTRATAAILAATLSVTGFPGAAQDTSTDRSREGYRDIYDDLATAMSPTEALDTLLDSISELDAIEFADEEGEAIQVPEETEYDGAFRVNMACLVTTNMPLDLCGCVAAEALQAFDETGMALLTSIILGDEASVTALRSESSFDTLTRASMFMVTVPPTCQPL